jgi:hypothetical protein
MYQHRTEQQHVSCFGWSAVERFLFVLSLQLSEPERGLKKTERMLGSAALGLVAQLADVLDHNAFFDMLRLHPWPAGRWGQGSSHRGYLHNPTIPQRFIGTTPGPLVRGGCHSGVIDTSGRHLVAR